MTPPISSSNPVLPAAPPLRIVLAGGSGHIGQILAAHFHSSGHYVTVLSRNPSPAACRVVGWDGAHLGAWTRELDGADALINLAGRSVNCRYSSAHRREIMDSRIGPTRLLGQAVSALERPPRLWLNASTATIYRHHPDRPMDEAGEIGGSEPGAPPAWRFSIEVATRWEEAFFAAAAPHTRKIALRSAIVMDIDRGGPFDLLVRLVRYGLGGASGSGTQFVSWIHQDDFVRAVDFLISHQELAGLVNIAAPNPLPNREFMRALQLACGKKIALPASQWMLEFGAVFLRTETELVLKSRRVVPGRLLESGFHFHFPEWPAAAADLVKRWNLACPDAGPHGPVAPKKVMA